MAEEGIILPKGPLFLVDRSLSTSKRKNQSVKRNTLSIRNHVFPVEVHKATKSQAQSPTTSTRIQSLQFVNTTRPKHHLDPKMQRVVRSHAMKEVAKVKSRPKRFISVQKNSFHQNDEKVEIKSSDSPPQDLSILVNPTGSTVPCFGGIDFKIKSSYQGFLQYYTTKMAQALYPLERHAVFQYNPIRSYWLPAAIADEALLYTILLSSAVHHAFETKKLDYDEMDSVLKVILRLLNERVARTELTDETIGAVSCLAMGENLLGHHENSRIHINGLREMVQARGGYQNINPRLRLKIYRADVQAATDELSEPLLTRLTRTLPPIYDSVAPGPFPTSQFLMLLSNSDISSEMLSIFIDLARFSAALNFAIEKSIAVHPTAFEEDFVILQYRLIDLSIQSYGFDDACRLAAILYIQSLSRENAFSRQICHNTTRRLKQAIQQTNVNKNNEHMFFWCTFLGALASSETMEREWFRKELDLAAARLQCRQWYDVKHNLEKVLWIGIVHDHLGIHLWNQFSHPPSI